VKCNWRLLREGLMSALPFINHQTITLTYPDFAILLKSGEPVLFKEFSEEFRNHLSSLEAGTVIMSIDIDSKIDPNIKRRLWYLGWRGNNSLNLCVKKKEIESLRNIFLSSNYKY